MASSRGIRLDEGPRVLVTGAAGFVGSNLSRALVGRNVELHGLVRATSDLRRIADLPPRLHLHVGDLRDAEGLASLMREIRPEAIVHTAIQGVGREQKDRREMIGTNVLGAHHLITCAQEVGCKRVVVTGGSSEYGRKSVPMSELDLLEPISLYGATKAAASLLFQQAARESGFPVVILRLFSVYGYGEPEHRLIPTAIRAALGGDKLRLTGAGWCRDFVFIEDVVDACLRALELEDHHGEIINIGSGVQTSNEDVVGIIDRLTVGGLETVTGAYAPHSTDSRFWVADRSKAKRILDWEPRHTLEEGLRKIIDSFKATTKARMETKNS